MHAYTCSESVQFGKKHTEWKMCFRKIVKKKNKNIAKIYLFSVALQ